MHQLITAIQPYAWGSVTAIPELLGVPPSGQPQAELWMGTHPTAPSKLATTGQELAQYIDLDPAARLGQLALKAFGSRLPFLFKVLAAAEPLSLQAHPTRQQAEAGFAREDAANVALTSPNRNYRDKQHKPELICALTPFWALCGFRDVEETWALIQAIGSSSLSSACAPLATEPKREAVRTVVLRLLAMQSAEAEHLVRDLVERCKLHQSAGGTLGTVCGWILRIASLYPGDPGVAVALLLNMVRLEPGQALYLHAGNLHAYLEGTAVEIMASSDNVLRGGLTKKHVDVPELSRVLDFESGPVRVLTPEPINAHEHAYRTDAAEFELSRVEFGEGDSPTLTPLGPEIWLVTLGTLHAKADAPEAPLAERQLTLERGAAAFVSADEGPITLSGSGVLYRAKVGQLEKVV